MGHQVASASILEPVLEEEASAIETSKSTKSRKNSQAASEPHTEQKEESTRKAMISTMDVGLGNVVDVPESKSEGSPIRVTRSRSVSTNTQKATSRTSRKTKSKEQTTPKPLLTLMKDPFSPHNTEEQLMRATQAKVKNSRQRKKYSAITKVKSRRCLP